MAPACILVIESHALQREVLVKALTRLHLKHVFTASNAEQALACLHFWPAVDLVFFDPTDNSINYTELVHTALQSGKVRAAALYSKLSIELNRAIVGMTAWASMPLLGVVEKPLKTGALQPVLARLVQRHKPSVHETDPLIPEHEVHDALARGEFEAWYQPKFDLHSTRLFGAEVLVRWNHPVRGLLLPREILANVLAYDLADAMFKDLLAQGMKMIAAVQKLNVVLNLAFNLSASQLLDNRLTGHIIRSWGQNTVNGSVLMLEIPEHGLLDLPASAVDNLMQLHQAGCSLTVDNFGQGFSSLRLLTNLPFNQLKLDSVFVQHLDTPSYRAAIACSLAMAKALQMDLVVGGIADQHTLDHVLDLGCAFGQGFHLARPMSSQEFFAWLVRHRSTKRKIDLNSL